MPYRPISIFHFLISLLLLPFSMPGQERIRIGILTDCQYCNCEPGESRWYPYSLQKLDSCIADLNSRNLDAIFHLGDMIDHDFASYDSVLPRFKKFHPPLNLVYGNHDFMVQEEYKKDVPDKTGLGRGYYYRDAGSWRFIVLNGDDLSYFAPQEKEQKSERSDLITGMIASLRSNMMPWNGGIGNDQAKWLDKLLSEADTTGRRVVVLCHFPVFPFSWYNLWNDRGLADLMSGHPSVKAYFNGHYHPGNYGCYNGIHFINFKGMVQTKANAYAVVTLTRDSIFVEGKFRETSRRLKIR